MPRKNNKTQTVAKGNNLIPVYNRDKTIDEVNKALSIKTEEDTVLSEEVNRICNELDLYDQNSIISYGSEIQNRMTSFSENILNNTTTRDLGIVGDSITSMVHELESFEIDKERNIFVKLFKRGKHNIKKLKAKYEKIEPNINEISKNLQKHQQILGNDINQLEGLFNNNLEYLKEIEVYITAGKKKLKEVNEIEIPKLEEICNQTNNADDIQRAKDLRDMAIRFEKRIYDLELTRQIAIQSMPQIRLVQNNNAVMIEKIQSTIVNTIPLWKNQLVLTIGLHHSNEAAKAQELVTNTTNNLLKHNDEMLKMSAIETARASERAIIDIDTLKHTNKLLVDTLSEVISIQKEGKLKREAGEKEIHMLEADLKKKILNLNANNKKDKRIN